MKYEQFIERKLPIAQAIGFACHVESTHLFEFQRRIVEWSLARGRAAVFAATGLGKSRMQVAWASHMHEHSGRNALILAPLAVAAQTAAEGAACGMPVTLCREASDVRPGVNVTNYDRLHKFDPAAFGAIVLDESSIIKNFNSRTLSELLAAFSRVPYRLACTATPSPNDYTELGTHAEFLGVCTRAEMLAEFFCHDGGETQTWRLKGHAAPQFWRWVSSWGAQVRRPSDLGYPDDGYDLPGLDIIRHTIGATHEDAHASGKLFADHARTLTERRAARKATVAGRVAECAALVNANPSEQWLVWCDLNEEGDALERACDGAVQVAGADTPEDKESRLLAFARGEVRVLVSKPRIAGWGMNFQRCARMAFVGVNDSFESQYQAIRRCYRFGQSRPVEVHMFASELEGEVIRNLARKHESAESMGESLSACTREAVMGDTDRRGVRIAYRAGTRMRVPSWLATGG